MVGMEQLPAFIVYETMPVLTGDRRGASTQLGPSYFESMESVLGSLKSPDAETAIDNRLTALERSRERFDDLTVDVDSMTVTALIDASLEVHETIRRMPEIHLLRAGYPGSMVAVPEWLRSDDELNYGIRLYWFRSDDAPEPKRIVRHNVEGVIHGHQREFERFSGQLHGYPQCCVDFYARREGTPPEWESVRPVAEQFDLPLSFDPTSEPLDDALPSTLELDGGYGFFAREFFPEPSCDVAIARGQRISEVLEERFDRRSARDYFRLNFLFGFLEARNMVRGVQRRPTVADLGREAAAFYLPYAVFSTQERYVRGNGPDALEIGEGGEH